MGAAAKQLARSNGRNARPAFDVLVIGTRPIVRLGILAILDESPNFRLCGEAADASEALQAARLRQPDLAVVDIDVRGNVGLKLIQQLKQSFDGLSILALSHQPDAYFAGQVLAAGARGYVTTWEDGRAIAEAMQAVAQGQTYLRANLVGLFAAPSGNNGSVATAEPTMLLTQRELEVFDLIGSGRATKQIARQLRLSVHTIETYRERIRNKLGDLDGAELVYQAIVWKLLNG
ncbi:MAG TPA: response regulator transcription factor [Pirellulales bacterium]|jgi:DNA-binding NarL/FixJ family response regulator|nr:response regulator transcription factor [Pirellulales bacterium]